MDNIEAVIERFKQVAPRDVEWSIRVVATESLQVLVRRSVLQPVRSTAELGAMITVHQNGGAGYAATDDLTNSGLRRACQQAATWAQAVAKRPCIPPEALAMPDTQGQYQFPAKHSLNADNLAACIERCQALDAALAIDEKIVDHYAGCWSNRSISRLVSSAGGDISQDISSLVPLLQATANGHGQTQTRGIETRCASQGGLEVMDALSLEAQAPQLAAEAITLLTAPECPADRRDLILLPAQMVLQIHESIGHPLELDRILGDERNYAGTSFVTPDMFGSYRYGSDLLNVTFDPTVTGQLASYAYDDAGTTAERVHIIENGILQRPLGSALSQRRAGLPGTANSRACAWNRPPIDRMANLNVEPGTTPLAEMIAGVERGILMDVTTSWSIDDSRNKFQFGCEYGRLIENGACTELVRNPGYRGISAEFWRNLAAVGTADEWEVFGTPNCGKGEPNQQIGTGHAAPPCLFKNVEVFGGG